MINKAPVPDPEWEITATGATVESNSYTWVYDGQAHTASAAVKNAPADASYRVSYSATPSITDVGTLSVTATATSAKYEDLTTTFTLKVTPKPLTVTATATDRAYIASNTTVTVSVGDLNGVITGDVVSIVSKPTTGTMADDSVGNNKNVTIAEMTLTGADAGNYTLSQPTVTVNITKGTVTDPEWEITATGATVESNSYTWVYDGQAHTASAAVKNAPADASYRVSYSATPSITDVGTLSVTATATSAKYEDLTTTFTLKVTPKPLTVTATATDRAYIASNTTVTVSVGDLNGVITGDVVSIVSKPTTGTMADDSVGNNKNVTIAEMTLTGADAGNYTLSQPTVTVNITKGTVTDPEWEITATGATVESNSYTWVYDGQAHTASAAVKNAPADASYRVSYSATPSITDVGTLSVTATATSPSTRT